MASDIRLAKDGIHKVELIAEDTFRIDETGIVNCYLLIGKSRALLIDSGDGVGNIYQTVRELTSLPVDLALTHLHCDHAGGRGFLKTYFVHKDDKNLSCRFLSSRLASRLLLKANKVKGIKLSKKPYYSKAIYIDEKKVFDLGGRKVSLVHNPGHTKGSVTFLDDFSHLMFTGDDVKPYLFLQLPGGTSLSTWFKGAEKILSLCSSYIPFSGHMDWRNSKEQIASLIKLGHCLMEEKINVKGSFVVFPEDKKASQRIFIRRKKIK